MTTITKKTTLLAGLPAITITTFAHEAVGGGVQLNGEHLDASLGYSSVPGEYENLTVTVSNGTQPEEVMLMRGAGETLFQGSTSFRLVVGTTSTGAGTTSPARTDIRQGAFTKTATVA